MCDIGRKREGTGGLLYSLDREHASYYVSCTSMRCLAQLAVDAVGCRHLEPSGRVAYWHLPERCECRIDTKARLCVACEDWAEHFALGIEAYAFGFQQIDFFVVVLAVYTPGAAKTCIWSAQLKVSSQLYRLLTAN